MKKAAVIFSEIENTFHFEGKQMYQGDTGRPFYGRVLLFRYLPACHSKHIAACRVCNRSNHAPEVSSLEHVKAARYQKIACSYCEFCKNNSPMLQQISALGMSKEKE